jgi:ubiquinone/menaquinone biosynthesis C-methylase UbiE
MTTLMKLSTATSVLEVGAGPGSLAEEIAHVLYDKSSCVTKSSSTSTTATPAENGENKHVMFVVTDLSAEMVKMQRHCLHAFPQGMLLYHADT